MELRKTVVAKRRMTSSETARSPGTRQLRNRIIFGVLKNIHPSISNENIIDDLVLNKVPVHRIHRLHNRHGPTYCVRVSFHTNRPNAVLGKSLLYHAIHIIILYDTIERAVYVSIIFI